MDGKKGTALKLAWSLQRPHYTMKGTTLVPQCEPLFSPHWFRCVPSLPPRSFSHKLTTAVYNTHRAPCGAHGPLCVPLAHLATEVYPAYRVSDSTLWLSHLLFLSLIFLFVYVKWTYLTDLSFFRFYLPGVLGTHRHRCVLHTSVAG
jgi:hypothetical protein